jgi:hypothetical protein
MEKNLQQQQDKFLFIGTDEQTAKSAPVKGVNLPIFLTDVYPTYFCPRDVERWGIISVNLKYLGMPNPYPHNAKYKWQKSLETCGLCTYHHLIPPTAIEKVMIYTPYGKHSNDLITELLLAQPDPRHLTTKAHKSKYENNLCLTKWLNGEEVTADSFESCFTYKESVKDKIHNKSGLDIYYIRAEEKKRRKVQ